MTDAPILIPVASIDDAALTRDRAMIDPEALTELQLSVATSGLRMPVEVFELAEPDGAITHGLISGFRRVAVFRKLHELSKQDKYLSIPAFVRRPASVTAAVVAMVEENEIRAAFSPYERGRIAVTATEQGLFGTIEEAVDTLYSTATKQKRGRLRMLARLAEEIGGEMTDPESLSQARALRLARAFQSGLGDLIRATLEETTPRDHESQWHALVPILEEAEASVRDDPAMTGRGGGRGGRPRRTLRPRHGLVIRREVARDGWILRFSGREATSMLLDAVFDEIEGMFAPR